MWHVYSYFYMFNFFLLFNSCSLFKFFLILNILPHEIFKLSILIYFNIKYFFYYLTLTREKVFKKKTDTKKGLKLDKLRKKLKKLCPYIDSLKSILLTACFFLFSTILFHCSPWINFIHRWMIAHVSLSTTHFYYFYYFPLLFIRTFCL